MAPAGGSVLLLPAAALLLLLLARAAAASPASPAARFGDRLAPRRPAAYGPRSAPHPAPHRLAPDDYEDTYEQEYDEHTTAQPDPEPQPPRRPARTEAHRLEMSTEYFVVPPRPSPAPPSSPRPPLPQTTALPANETTPPPALPVPRGALRPEAWAVPVLALACACMATLGAFEAWVVWCARRRSPSQRHLLLGQTLLLGLFACAGTAALYAATPSAFTCGAVRFGTGVSYVIVFASLLVKCVFLLSLNGGVYLPAAYQGLLLFFAVLIQVAIGAQWLGTAPARVGADGRCAARLPELLLSLVYAAALAAVVCCVALRSRAIRDNYREAWHIAGAAGAACAVWLCWTAAAWGAPEGPLRDACVAAGLLATCAVVFALMFAPKGRRLAALGREGRWPADRDEGLSSLGAPASGYSPSFFHFKPVKYGMVLAGPAAAIDRKDPPAQPADVFGAPWPAPPARPLYSPPHHHYSLHPLMHYYNYPPYHYLLPPGNYHTSNHVRGVGGMVPEPEEGAPAYPFPLGAGPAEPCTFSTNPNVYFQRSEPLHVGMMY